MRGARLSRRGRTEYGKKNCDVVAKMNASKQFPFIIFIKLYLIPFTQGANHLHTLYRNEIIVILKMSDFYDVMSDFFTSIERLLSNYHLY